MKAVIMAGGFGTRLRPITCNIPKPMAPVANVPMMEHIINLLKQYDFKRICSILYFQPEVITNYFGDGKKFDIEMEYQMAAADYGTAGSVKNTEAKLKDEPFIIISGDVLTDFDLSEAIKFHQEKKAMATMVLTRVANPLEYGVVITGEDGKIIRFLEKPSWGEVFSDTINTGIYILEPEIFKYIPEKTEFDFSKNLFPLMLKEGLPLYGYIADGYWKDIGSLDEYILAHQNVLNGDVRVQLPGERLNIVGRDVYVGKNIKMKQNKVKLKGGVVIGNNCVIEDGCELENCVIGDDSVVHKGARLKGTTVWSNVEIGERAELGKAVIGSRSRIEEGAEVESGAIISEDCIIGKNAVIRENVKIWPKKEVEEGQTVASSFNTPTLFTIAKDLTDMRVIADVDEADIGEVKEGQRVSFTVDAFPNDTFEGAVTQVRQQPTTESNVVTYQVVISAPNQDLKLKPGLTANVNIFTLEMPGVLAIPSKALRFKPSEAMLNDGETITDVESPMKVWTKEGPNLKAIAVQTGVTNGTLTQITSGLTPGTKVIVDVQTSMPDFEEGAQQNSNPFMPKPKDRNKDKKKQ